MPDKHDKESESSSLDLAIANFRKKLSTPEGKAEFIAEVNADDSDYIKKYRAETRFDPRKLNWPIAEPQSPMR